MSNKDKFFTVVDDRNRTTREFVDLQTENARLREAVKAAQDLIAALSLVPLAKTAFLEEHALKVALRNLK